MTGYQSIGEQYFLIRFLPDDHATDGDELIDVSGVQSPHVCCLLNVVWSHLGKGEIIMEKSEEIIDKDIVKTKNTKYKPVSGVEG